MQLCLMPVTGHGWPPPMHDHHDGSESLLSHWHLMIKMDGGLSVIFL
jgi:hypothetical protein